MSSTGERIKAERIALGWSQTKLAAEVNRYARSTGEDEVSQSSIAKLESRASQAPRSPRAFALALGVLDTWLISGKGPRHAPRMRVSRDKTKVPIVGYVGAGAEIIPFDDFPKGGGLDEIPCPAGLNPARTVAAIVRGRSMEPAIPENWRVFYSRDPEQAADGVIGKLCVVKITDGPTMLKQVRKGATDGLFNLLSFNAGLLEDQELDWASPVRAMQPPEMDHPDDGR